MQAVRPAQPVHGGGRASSARWRALARPSVEVHRALPVVDGAPVVAPRRREARGAASLAVVRARERAPIWMGIPGREVLGRGDAECLRSY